jgi:hypothetical protein
MLICKGGGEIHHRREDADDVDSIIRDIILDWEMLKRVSGVTDKGILRFVQDSFENVPTDSLNKCLGEIKSLVYDETPEFQKKAYNLVIKKNDPILSSIKNVFILWKEFLTRILNLLEISTSRIDKIFFCPKRPVNSLKELFKFPIEKHIRRVNPEHEYLELLEGLKRVLCSLHIPISEAKLPPKTSEVHAPLIIDGLLRKIERCSGDIKAMANDRVKIANSINRISTYLIAVNAYLM